jgi:hypothetical protein
VAKKRKSVGLIGAAVFGVSLGAGVDAVAFERAVNAGSKQALEQFIQQHPTSEYAGQAVDLLLSQSDGVASASSVDAEEVGIAGY